MSISVKDFGLATLLVSKDCPYSDYVVDELGRIWFQFDNNEKVRELKDGFYRNTVDVRIQDFIKTQTALKTLIFDIRRSANGYESTGRRAATEIR